MSEVDAFALQNFRKGWGRTTWYPRLSMALRTMLVRTLWQEPTTPAEMSLDDVCAAIDRNRNFLVREAEKLVEEVYEVDAKRTATSMKGAFDDL